MLYKNGIFWPDNFPWPYDSALSVARKLAIINCMPLTQILKELTAFRECCTGQAGDERFHSLIESLYLEPSAALIQTHLISAHSVYFPKSVAHDFKYCARCAEELGFVSVYFSLRFIEQCPWHRQRLRPLCRLCLNIHTFRPPPLGARWGHDCPHCGFRLPPLSQLVRLSLAKRHDKFVEKSEAFLAYTRKLLRCGALDYVFLKQTLQHHDYPANDLETRLAPFAPATDTVVWRKVLCMPDTSNSDTGATLEAQVQLAYQKFCSFWQGTLLRKHAPCLDQIIRAYAVAEGCDTCLYATALFMFRLKFEFFVGKETQPVLSPEALSRIARLGMRPPQLRQYFSCYLHKILATLLFWRGYGSHSGIYVNTRNGFWDIFCTEDQYPDPLRLAGIGIMGRCYSRYFDLPGNRRAMRQMLNHHNTWGSLNVCLHGDIVCMDSPARSYLFGRFRPLGLVHF